MEEELYRAYLTLLDGLSGDLDQLAALEREKCAAVRRDDLKGLDDVMKREQVVSLSLRGREQKRQKLAAQLDLEGARLSGLTARVPGSLVLRAQETVERLQLSYGLYKEAAEVARSTLEINLHEIEKIIAADGVAPAQSASYTSPAASEPPKNMKTDFRA